MVNTVKVPPDGGYGWVIVFANALSNFIVIPVMTNFGMIFSFASMGLNATEGSIIINLNAAFGMILGLLNGVLLKKYGYRKVAFAASFLITFGLILTSFAKTFAHFIVGYGLITSLGMGMNLSAFSLALNTYFRKNKSKAVGYAMTLTGLGPITMPHLIGILKKTYGPQGATLVLGAIAANCFIAASLLHPVKWHMKTEVIQEQANKDNVEEMETENKTEARISLFRSVSQVESKKGASVEDLNESMDDLHNPVYGMDSAFAGSVISLHSVKRKISVVSNSWKKGSLASLPHTQKGSIYNPEMSRPFKTKPYWKRLLSSLVKFFDLDLLKDPIFVNIMIGLSVAVFAEINFSLLTPYILADFGLNTDQTATFLSIQGFADLVFRFLAPYIGQVLKQPARPMYLLTLFLLMSTRFSLLLSNEYKVLLAIAFGLGVAKGVRTIYMSLVIPTYVPLEKLASAFGLQMMVNGFCVLAGGPVIGVIRDVTGSFNICIVVLNIITASTIVIWTCEFVIMRLRRKKEVKPSEQQDTLLNKK